MPPPPCPGSTTSWTSIWSSATSTSTWPRSRRRGRRMVAFLGGTIGNLDPAQRARFLFDLNCTMSSDDSLAPRHRPGQGPERLVAAYDDAAGVTADFNRNVLHVLNEQLGGDFDPDNFRHVAVWNEDEQWIEMRLRAQEAAEVSLAGRRHHGPFRRGRGPPHRDQREVHPRARRARAHRGRLRGRGDVGRRGRRVPALAVPPVLLTWVTWARRRGRPAGRGRHPTRSGTASAIWSAASPAERPAVERRRRRSTMTSHPHSNATRKPLPARLRTAGQQ